MKFLIDMNMSPGWEEVLKAVGVEAVHWSRIGPPDADDPQIMEHAFLDGYVVFTNDLDLVTY